MILSGTIILVNPVAFAKAAIQITVELLFGIFTSFKYVVFMNDKQFILVTCDGISYVSDVFPGGYAYNIEPSFENKTPSIEEKFKFTGSTVILVNFGKFENNKPVLAIYLFINGSFCVL